MGIEGFDLSAVRSAIKELSAKTDELRRYL